MKTLIESIGSLIVALFVWAIWLSFVVLAPRCDHTEDAPEENDEWDDEL